MSRGDRVPRVRSGEGERERERERGRGRGRGRAGEIGRRRGREGEREREGWRGEVGGGYRPGIVTLRNIVPAFGLLALTLLGSACSPESKAKKALEDYEVVFEECKKITEETKTEVGKHYCSKVGSMALEMSMADTGLDAAAQKQMIDEWAKSNPLGKYYADEKAREAIPN